jgi:hypothetical protein
MEVQESSKIQVRIQKLQLHQKILQMNRMEMGGEMMMTRKVMMRKMIKRKKNSCRLIKLLLLLKIEN